MDLTQCAFDRYRGMRGSKVFRRATELFGDSTIIRKRQFNALPNVSAVEEQTLGPSALANSVYAKPRVYPSKAKKSTMDSTSGTEVGEYHEWLEQRKGMRAQLEQLGNVEKWLTGKECTPSERKFLTYLQTRNPRSAPSVLSDETQVHWYDTP